MVLTWTTQDSLATFVTESLANLTQAPLHLLSNDDKLGLEIETQKRHDHCMQKAHRL